jgi:hypothetical protein
MALTSSRKTARASGRERILNAKSILLDALMAFASVPALAQTGSAISVVGKRANCQALVSLTLADREVPIPLGLRLFLPQEWTDDPARCAAAGVPDEAVIARSKGTIALAEVDRLRAAEVRFATVLAMPVMARAPPSVTVLMPGACAGRLASRAPRRSTTEASS